MLQISSAGKIIRIVIYIVFISIQSQSQSLVETRITTGIDHMLVNPWPYPDANWKAKYAYLLIAKNQRIDFANQLVQDWCAAYELDSSAAPTAYHDRRPEAALYSLYLKPEYYNVLEQRTRDAIEDVCWRWVYRHSFISKDQSWPLNNPTKNVWLISGSENHDAAQRSANLLSLQVLRKAGKPFGHDATLYDGFTVEEHYLEWVKWYQEFFLSRMRHGLNCEVAHPSSYGLATISHYYDIEDLSDDADLKKIAGDYLTVFWANVASEFEPKTGIRGSLASTRNYKWSWNQNGDIYWARSLLYAYGWTDVKSNPNLTLLTLYLSDYRPPEIVQAIASDTNRGSYMSTSRRFGRGTGWDRGIYQVRFDDGLAYNSYMRRDSWYTPAYTMSALSLAPGRDYTQLIDQSRVMGVSFSNNINDRIIVYGGNTPVVKDVEYKMPTSNGVNGLLGENCLIVARDPNADMGTTNSTRIFISDGDLWNNKLENDDGWFFTKAGDAYAGFKIAGDSAYTVVQSPYNNGYYLEFKDIWAPVVIQTGEAKDYGNNFEQFRNAVKERPIAYVDGILTYTALSSDKYEYRSKSTTIPKINDETFNLNPVNTYHNPYLLLKHGEDTVTISYTGYPDLKIPLVTQNTSVGISTPSNFFKGVSVHPNPTNGKVNINLGNLKDVTVKAYTIEGQLIYQKDNILTSMHQLEIKGDTGLYIINVSSQDKSLVFKVIKE